jgi:hypothetical protein
LIKDRSIIFVEYKTKRISPFLIKSLVIFFNSIPASKSITSFLVFLPAPNFKATLPNTNESLISKNPFSVAKISILFFGFQNKGFFK